ncbi:hypothetical protein F2P81_008307 [Scophthalmus maximus]|uniref:Uncharacterized protein n=1 Tax=Scophthalmus maximus TaxID=52904 RepID=A0A6A4TCZ2_SCOMX|nr:hypothetical protein F2P81_008307 [Scophthalmus maximus]
MSSGNSESYVVSLSSDLCVYRFSILCLPQSGILAKGSGLSKIQEMSLSNDDDQLEQVNSKSTAFQDIDGSDWAS